MRVEELEMEDSLCIICVYHCDCLYVYDGAYVRGW
jgi:hypothetical protein